MNHFIEMWNVQKWFYRQVAGRQKQSVTNEREPQKRFPKVKQFHFFCFSEITKGSQINGYNAEPRNIKLFSVKAGDKLWEQFNVVATHPLPPQGGNCSKLIAAQVQSDSPLESLSRIFGRIKG